MIIKSRKLIEAGTPASQIGGRKKSSTIEHIVMAMTVARSLEAEKKAVVILFVDVIKCFDQIRLKDTTADAAAVGVSGRKLRMVRKLHDKTEISIVGDVDNHTAVITNSTGQGTQMAPSFCSLSMARALNQVADREEYGMKYGEVQLKPCSFIDDTKLMSETAGEARKSGKIASDSLDLMGLGAHPKKTKQVVLGNAKAREILIKELTENPAVIQGFNVEFSERETYLGFEFCQQGTRESVTQSIEKRGRVATAKTIQLVKVLEDDLVQKVGFLAAAKYLFQSIVMSSLSYGAQGYIYMTRKQEDRMESLMRENLYRLLGLSKFTSYAAVLFELNLVKMKDVIKMLKCSFVMSLMTDKSEGQCFEVLKEEEKKGRKGIISEVKEICEQFGLPDITVQNISKDKMKKQMWKVARDELWQTVLMDRRVPYQECPKKYKKDYWSLEKRRALLVFAYKIGNLDFRNNKKGEALRKFGSTACLASGCPGRDDLQHIIDCSGYDNKPEEGAFDGDDVKLADYLDKVDAERFSKWRAPLLFRRTAGTANVRPKPKLLGLGVPRVNVGASDKDKS